MQVARKNLRLLVEGEALDGYSTLRRGARAADTDAGTFQLDPRFVPPLLDFRASDYLIAIARRLVEILIGALQRHRRDCGGRRTKALADFTAADIANFWLLYTINTAFPAVPAPVRNARRTSGRAVSRRCSSLAGRADHVFDDIHPRDLPLYDHDDLGACFTDLDEKLRHAARNRGADATSFRCR